MKTIIFTDLDGTLLDKSYSINKTKPMLSKLKAFNVDIVFCSSKTRKEIEHYQQQTNIKDPFITENGAVIYVRRNTLKIKQQTKQIGTYEVIELGTSYKIIKGKIKKIADQTATKIIGFGEMNEQEIAKRTGLTFELAMLAKQREYTEPVIFDSFRSEILEAASTEGLRIIRGDKYYHFTGQHDKGEAVKRLKSTYEENFGEIYTIGVGNGPNDLSMLKVVDAPIRIKKSESREEVWKNILSKVQSRKG